MPVRKLNYTNRKKIRREDARISLRTGSTPPSFDAELRLGPYNLPPDARVYVEAYRQSLYMRFDYGRVAGLTIPSHRDLVDFGSHEGVLFRVKVVSESGVHGILLAEADQIRPRSDADADDNRIPLIPVDCDDNMGDEIWRVEFDEQQTLLKMNSRLGDWRAVARSSGFQCLVYPSIVRIVLTRILIADNYRDEADPEDWQSRWLQFARALPGVGPLPPECGLSGEGELDAQDWIDRATQAFSRQHSVFQIYQREFGEGAADA